MAISPTIKNYGLLNAWQRRMQVSIWHFNQVAGPGDNAPIAENGDKAYIQPDRDSIAEGITQAIAMAINLTQFYPRPVYVHERIKIGRGWPRTLQTLQTRWKYVQAIGRRGTTVIESAATVVYSDSDGDGVDDLATITTTVTSGMDPAEIKVFFQVADGADTAASEYYEIEPLTVSVSGVTATITGHRALFVKPEEWATPYNPPNYRENDENVLDNTTAANFVTEVDVYRVYPDKTNAVNLYRDPLFYGCTDLDAWLYDGAVALVEDERLGLIRFRPTSDVCYDYSWEYVDLYYLAGYPLNSLGNMEQAIEQAMIRLANTYMPNAPASLTDRRLQYWQTDVGLMTAGRDDNPIGQDSPFGQLNGQVQAWKVLNRYAVGKGGMLGVSR